MDRKSKYPSREREARAKAWRKWKRKVTKGALAEHHKCLCGEQAIKYRNGWVCARCNELEKDHHRNEASGSGKSYADHVFSVALNVQKHWD